MNNPGSSSEETNTSSSPREYKTNELTSHVVNFKESKTHLFYVIQSDNDNNEKAQHLIRIKISKERPTSRKFVGKKMLLRCGSKDNVTEEKAKRISKQNLASIHKKTDHPSFVVLPEVFSNRRDDGNVRKKLERNQSTSENSNETYVIRSKEENKIFGNKVPKLLGTSLWEKNSLSVDAATSHGTDADSTVKSGDYCECDNSAAGKSANKPNRDSFNLNKNKTEPTTSAKKTSAAYLKKDELFNINFVEPTPDVSQRLRAGQDVDMRYKSCYLCHNMTKIFPPTNSERRTAFHSNYSDSGSNSSLKKRSGYVKINFKLVRQCLLNASANEKCQVLDAIRLRMKSPDFNLAMNTIEDIVKFDLFGVQCECRSKPLLEELFWPINVTASYELQTSIAQFVNALVSYKIGRAYFSNRPIIHMLTWGDIGRDNIDPIMGDNLIGIMMKLSRSRFHRSDMIKNGLLRWLLKHMEEQEYSTSKYHLQCMAGLLRNLLRGYNLDDLSPIEIQKLIVLLGRYLDTENVTAKRYICDALMILFQNIKNVTSAKELNFQRVIEEHETRTENSKQKEHLRAVYQLLNRSVTSKSFSSQKFDSRSEDEPYLDTDLEPDINGEVDCYPGECLLREKFSGDAEVHFDDKNFKEPKVTADHTHKGGRLISRTFVEHLNCFLPNIEKNRIFPLCNDRCADKIRACSHLEDNQPKKRQPYIPPNSRTSGFPRQQQSYDDSIEVAAMTTTNAHYKSGMKSGPSEIRLKNTKTPSTTKIYTISNDKSAARWDYFENMDGNTRELTKGGSAEAMEAIFLRPSMTTVDDPKGIDLFGRTGDTGKKGQVDTKLPVDSKCEEVVTNIRYYNDAPESAETMKNKRKNDKATIDQQLPGTGNMTYKDHGIEVVGKIEHSPGSGNVTYNDRGIEVGGKTVNDGIYTSAKNEKSLPKSEVLRRKAGEHNSRNTSVDKARPIARHFSENSIAQQSTKKGENEIGRELHAKSEETLTNLERGKETTETTNKNLIEKKIGRESVGRTVESNQLNPRSEEFLKKKTLGTSRSISKARSEASIATMKQTNIGHKLCARSEDDLVYMRPGEEKEIGSKLDARSKENLIDQKTGEKLLTAKSNQLNARSEVLILNTNTKYSPASTAAKGSPISEVTVAYHLLVRSAEVLSHPRNVQESSLMKSKSLIEIQNQNYGTSALVLDDSVLMDGKSEGIKDSSEVIVGAGKYAGKERLPEQNVGGIGEANMQTGESSRNTRSRERNNYLLLNARSEEGLSSNRNIMLKSEQTAESNASIAIGGIQKDRPEDKIGRVLYARSDEMLINPKTRSTLESSQINYQSIKSSSEKVTGASRNQQYTLGQTVKENTRINEIQMTARSEELVNVKGRGRTQSNTALDGLKKSHNSIISSQSSINRSKDCVDCEGSGYVLRARPSQPCDQCKVSLTKYPKFVNALNNEVMPPEDYQRRVVTRTSDDCIKVTWSNKSDEKVITKPDQEHSNEEKHDKTKIGGKLTDPKNNVVEARKNTSSAKDMSSSKEISANKPKENITSTKDLMDETNLRSSREGHAIVGRNELSEIKSKETVNHISRSSCLESVRNVKSVNLSETNDKFELDSIPKSQVPNVLSSQLPDTLVKNQGNESEVSSMDKTKERVIHSAKSEHLLLARSVETTTNDERRIYDRLRSDEVPKNDSTSTSNMQDNQSLFPNDVIKDSTNLMSESRPESDEHSASLVSTNTDIRGTRNDQNSKNEKTSRITNVVSSSMNKSQELMDEKYEPQSIKVHRSKGNESDVKTEHCVASQIAVENSNGDSNSGSNGVSNNGDSNINPSKYCKELNARLTRPECNKYLPVTPKKYSSSPKFVANVIDKTIINSEGDQCLQVATVTNSREEFVGNVETVMGLKEQATETELEKTLCNNDEEVNNLVTETVGSLKLIPIPDGYSSTNLVTLVEYQSEQDPITPLEKSVKQSAITTSNEESVMGSEELTAEAEPVKTLCNNNDEVNNLVAETGGTSKLIPIPDCLSSTNLVTAIECQSEQDPMMPLEKSVQQAAIITSNKESHSITNGKPNLSIDSLEVVPQEQLKCLPNEYNTLEIENNLADILTPSSLQKLTTAENAAETCEKVSERTTNQRVGIGGVESIPDPLVIGRAEISQSSSLKLREKSTDDGIADDTVAHSQLLENNGKRNDSSNLMGTLTDNSSKEQKTMMPTVSSLEKTEHSNDNDHIENTDTKSNVQSSSTKDTKLGDKKMDNFNSDILPEANQKEQNLNISQLKPLETIDYKTTGKPTDSINFESERKPAQVEVHTVANGQNQSHTFIQPSQIEQLSSNTATVNVSGPKSDESTQIYNHQLSVAPQFQSDTVIPNAKQPQLQSDTVIPNAKQNIQSDSLKKQCHTVVAVIRDDKVLGARSLDIIGGGMAVQQDNQISLRDSLKKQEQSAVTKARGDKVLGARSLDIITGGMAVQHDHQNRFSNSSKKRKQSVLAPRSSNVVRGENTVQTPVGGAALKSKPSIIDNIKTNVLLARSNETVLTNNVTGKREQDQMDDENSENEVEIELNQKIKQETITEQGSDKELTDSYVKSIGKEMARSKLSIFSDEILMEETNLSSERQTNQYDTEVDQELSHGDCYKVSVVNSTCYRQLLHSEELIDILSEKVLVKILTEIHCCGPNCKSPCNGLNSYYKAKGDNNRNSE